MDQTKVQKLKALVEELEKEVASESLIVQELFHQLKQHIDTLRNFTFTEKGGPFRGQSHD